MISIHCTHCRQLLEMDDAFAGGVCRCQYCGTIQTVPSKLKSRPGSAKPSSSSSRGNSTKALYKKKSSAGPGDSAAPASDTKTGTGLDELAEVVASSGLSRGSLRQPPPRARDGGGDARSGGAPAAPRSRKPGLSGPLLIGGGAGVVLLLVAVIYFATAGPSTPPPPKSTGGTETAVPGITPGPGPSAAADPGPAFAGIPLLTGDVIYLIDRSQANEGFLDAVKAAAYRSAMSLGPKGRFQIIFWHRTDEGVVAYPEDGLASADKAEVDKAKQRFEDVVAYGTTDLKPTIEKAATSGPDLIVLVTAKGFSFEEGNVAAVIDALAGRPTKVHAVSLGDGESAALKRIADETGGEYRELTRQGLSGSAR